MTGRTGRPAAARASMAAPSRPPSLKSAKVVVPPASIDTHEARIMDSRWPGLLRASILGFAP